MTPRAHALFADLQEAAGRSFHAAGWAGVLGFALLLFAVSFDFTGNRTLEAEAASLRQEARALVARQHRPVRAESSERQRLEQFYAGLPGVTRLPDLLVRLHGYALARGVVLDRADYRTTVEVGTPLERVTLDLPAHGSYPMLRAWLDDLYVEMPELAVESLSIHRERIDAPLLEAQVRLTLFLRRSP